MSKMSSSGEKRAMIRRVSTGNAAFTVNLTGLGLGQRRRGVVQKRDKIYRETDARI
jgi:hypothetical protein